MKRPPTKTLKTPATKTLLSTSQKSSTTFGRSIRGAARGLWNDSIDFFTFVDTVISAVYRGYEQAWREGSAICGITPEERSIEEANVLQREVSIAIDRVMSFGDFVQNHRKADGWKLSSVMTRADLWANRYQAIVTRARSTSCADRKFVWLLGATREHCDDCARYNGRVHRGSVWQSVGALPQSTSLACHGYNCQCRLVPTTDRATPGRPSRPSG